MTPARLHGVQLLEIYVQILFKGNPLNRYIICDFYFHLQMLFKGTSLNRYIICDFYFHLQMLFKGTSLNSLFTLSVAHDGTREVIFTPSAKAFYHSSNTHISTLFSRFTLSSSMTSLCRASTRSGQNCTRRAQVSSDFCWQHRNSPRPEPILEKLPENLSRCSYPGCRCCIMANLEFCSIHEPDYMDNYYKQHAVSRAIMIGKIFVTDCEDIDKIIASYLSNMASWKAE
jgi:hypothetical protein